MALGLLVEHLGGLFVGVGGDRLRGAIVCFVRPVAVRSLGELTLGFVEHAPVGLRDLVVVGMDFAERQEAVPLAAIVDERGLQRRFDPGYLGEIDITFELLVLGGLEVKLLDPGSLDDRDPGLLRVARVDQHAHGH